MAGFLIVDEITGKMKMVDACGNQHEVTEYHPLELNGDDEAVGQDLPVFLFRTCYFYQMAIDVRTSFGPILNDDVRVQCLKVALVSAYKRDTLKCLLARIDMAAQSKSMTKSQLQDMKTEAISTFAAIAAEFEVIRHDIQVQIEHHQGNPAQSLEARIEQVIFFVKSANIHKTTHILNFRAQILIGDVFSRFVPFSPCLSLSNIVCPQPKAQAT